MTTFEYSRHILRRSMMSLAPAALAVLLLGGCSEPVETLDPAEPTPVNFTAGIRASVSSDGSKWTSSDLLGIFMVPAGGTVNQAHTGGNNRTFEFTDPAAGTIAPSDGQPMYYPGSEKVDFIANHYGGGSLNNNNRVSISTMKQFGWGLLYAKTENADRKSGPVNLSFRHMLGKVRVNIIRGADMENDNFLSMNVNLSGMPGSAKVDFNTGTLREPADVADIEMTETTAGEGFVATLEADVLPHEAGQFNGRTISFESSRMTKRTWNIPDANDIPAGMVRIYNLTISTKGITCSSCDIKDWTTNDNGAGSAEMLEVVRIPAGKNIIGDPDNGAQEVSVSSFYLGKYEVTRKQYAAFLNAVGIGKAEIRQQVTGDVAGYGQQTLFVVNQWGWTPMWNDATGRWEAEGDYPMIYVTWYGAKAYADWAGGRLPNLVEWEYACRAGTTTRYWFGDDESLLGNYEIFNGNATDASPKPIGSMKPNPWGLYDMHGNVCEWTELDIASGGSCFYKASDCFSFINMWRDSDPYSYIGFRLAFD